MKLHLLIVTMFIFLGCTKKGNTTLSTLIEESNDKLKLRTSFMPNENFWLISNTMLEIEGDSIFALAGSESKLFVGIKFYENPNWKAFKLRKNLDKTKYGLVFINKTSIIGLAYWESNTIFPFITTDSLKKDIVNLQYSTSFKYYIGNSIEIFESDWPQNTYGREEQWQE